MASVEPTSSAVPNAPAQRLHLKIDGMVQGVGFRWYVRESARRLDLAGWVRNNPDGTVELAASGDPECLALLRTAVRTGPRGAQVVEVRDLAGADDEPLERPFTVVK